MKASLYSYTSSEWKTTFEHLGHSPVLSYWLEGLRGKKYSWEKHLPPLLMEKLRDTYSFELPTITQVLEAEDGTVKFQTKFDDGLEAETVLIPFHKKYTVCLSTQVGCAMNCSFCYTGTQGLKRHLKAHEIVGQYLLGIDWLKNHHRSSVLPNIVFMGQGEPLHNVDEVLQAVKVLNDPLVVGVGQSQMTLSTVGHLPGMQKLSQFPKINFALSLHSPFPEQRSELIPVEKNYPLKDVLLLLDKISEERNQIITYEYLLIKDFNSSEAHAVALAELLQHRKAMVNLIPFNPFPGSQWQRPSETEIQNFKETLVKKKIRVLIRKTKGDDILAACGQLKINKLARTR